MSLAVPGQMSQSAGQQQGCHHRGAAGLDRVSWLHARVSVLGALVASSVQSVCIATMSLATATSHFEWKFHLRSCRRSQLSMDLMGALLSGGAGTWTKREVQELLAESERCEALALAWLPVLAKTGRASSREFMDMVQGVLEQARSVSSNVSLPPALGGLRCLRAVDRDLPVCVQCQEPVQHMSRCSRCRQVVYCSRKCQVDHWPMHKRLCTPSVASPPAS